MTERQRLASDLEDLAEFVEEHAQDLRIRCWVLVGARQRLRSLPLCDKGERRVRDLIERLRQASSMIRAANEGL